MERPKSQGLVDRIKSTGKARGSRLWANIRGYGTWTIFFILGLVVCTFFFTSTFLGNRANDTFSRIGSGLRIGGYSAADVAPPPAPGDVEQASSAPEGAPAENGQTSTGGSGQESQPWDRMIIRTATLQLTVGDVAAGVDKVRLLAVLHGGYVFGLESHQDGDGMVSSVTIQVPSQEFDKIMPELRKLDGLVKKIDNENVSSSDVTEEYTDLQSQLRNLQTTEARILALQQKAERLEDIMALDRELRQIQGEIERIQGRANFLSKRAEMSTITVNLAPVPVPVAPAPTPEPVKVEVWKPAETAVTAWNASLDLLARVTTVAIAVVVFFWWAIPLLLLAGWLVGRSRKRAAVSVPAGGESSAS